ncbi:MAG: adenosine kinase [Deltaproteobacteria bacterium]|nr:adenosine kinase [Deltaproteobacteria bacterium]
MKFDVFGIENPLIDLLAKVPDEFLVRNELKKNHMLLVDESRHRFLLESLDGVEVRLEAGGSCANTLLGISQLGGRTAYCGKVGGDEHGRTYISSLEAAGVKSYISSNGSVTGSTVILVTPDAARTMNTFLGACQELTPEDVPLEELKSSHIMYITGYLWDTEGQKEAATLALRTAGAEGVHVVMSLADPFCVVRHKEDFRDILDRYVDFVFANQEEALTLTDTDNTHEAMKVLRQWCSGAAITMGANGAYVTQGDEHIYLDPYPVNAVDTTGAGDAFAAGFMYGRISGASLFQCGRQGSYFASRVIQQVGPRLSGDIRRELAEVLDDQRP